MRPGFRAFEFVSNWPIRSANPITVLCPTLVTRFLRFVVNIPLTGFRDWSNVGTLFVKPQYSDAKMRCAAVRQM